MANPPDKAEEVREPNGLGQWMVRYGPILRRYFARKAHPADVDDLVQDVFLRLQARAEREPIEDAERFLFTVARGVLINRYRLNAAYRARLKTLFDDADPNAAELSPERIVEGREDFARAVDAILRLPPRMRTAFTLHRFDKLSYSAVAKRMGITKRSVQDLLSRAFERLTRELEKDQ